MRISSFVIPVIVAFLLSACSGPPLVIQRSKDPHYAGELDFQTPPGYTHGLVLKPGSVPPTTQERSQAQAQERIQAQSQTSAAAGGAVTWNDIGDYRQWMSGGAPEGAAPKEKPHPAAKGAAYNSDVSVFPLDGAGGDIVSYNEGWSAYGAPAEKVYFGHASARVGKADKAKLRKLARKGRKNLAADITVVGHASRRVDRVKDPIKKKMINLAMAQKRANAVTHELKKAGLKPAWVKAVSKGDEEPNSTPPPGLDQEAADRRVEIFMDGQ
jgi:outer membrane protein OmpA-like peptidoglycan-associated protein